jgi:UDP-glucose 4-epimerase
MRLHVTGACGLIGSHLARRWLELGADVTASDDLSGGYRDNLPPEVPLHVVDCADLDAMTRATEGAEVVYHCAAAAHDGLSVFSPLSVTRSVFVQTVAVAAACARNRVRRMIACSSMARYGAIRAPFTENQEPRPSTPYGAAKLAAERQVALIARLHGFEHAIAIPHSVVGPGQRYEDPFRNVVAIMANRCLLGRAPIVYGDGMQTRCFTHVDDAVAPMIAMASAPVDGEVFNVGPDEEVVTLIDLARMVMRAAGLDGEPVRVPDRPAEVKHADCSAEKARRLRGYRTTRSLRETVEELVEWVRRRGPRSFSYRMPIEVVDDRVPRAWLERSM